MNTIEQLIEDYKRRLSTITSEAEYPFKNRLRIKASCYKTFIGELNKAMREWQSQQEQPTDEMQSAIQSMVDIAYIKTTKKYINWKEKFMEWYVNTSGQQYIPVVMLTDYIEANIIKPQPPQEQPTTKKQWQDDEFAAIYKKMKADADELEMLRKKVKELEHRENAALKLAASNARELMKEQPTVTEGEKYFWVENGIGKLSYSVIHKEDDEETLIALTDTAEKAHFIAKSCNSQPTPTDSEIEQKKYTPQIIRCPECQLVQPAVIIHSFPFDTYIHRCEKCAHVIMESEWDGIRPYFEFPKPTLTDEQIEQMAEKEYPQSNFIDYPCERAKREAYIRGAKAILNYKRKL